MKVKLMGAGNPDRARGGAARHKANDARWRRRDRHEWRDKWLRECRREI